MSVPPPVRLDIPGNDGGAIKGRVGVDTGPCNGIHSHSCSASEGNTQTTEGTCSKFTADGKTSSRPWRKSARECIAERRHAAAVLGGESTISTRCVHRVMEVQELIDGMGGDAPDALQASVTELLQAATNNRPEPEVADARSRMESVLAQLGLVEAAAQRALRQTEASRSAVTKLQLMHQVMPRLWVGGWAALNNDCAALRVRRVTHVVSLVSGEKRRLPKFILGHHYVQVDDREQAASIMASHFPQIVLFIDEARNRGGVVYVHCGAGISRAPTVSEEHASRLRKTGPHGVYCVRSFAWLQSLSIVELGQNKTRLLS
uniref:Tyrosine specific protein phosphatases domain-containing protein n=1 Tax=Chrysotila carterae TaxID=13221 RepID=A0A7S4BFD0_CHRCT